MELKSFLLSKDVDLMHRVLMFFPLLDGAMRNSVCPNQLCLDRSWDPQAGRTLSVFLPKFCPSNINPELMMECQLIAHPLGITFCFDPRTERRHQQKCKVTRKFPSGSLHQPGSGATHQLTPGDAKLTGSACATMDSRHEPWPTSTRLPRKSGYVRSTRRRADCNMTPSCCAARPLVCRLSTHCGEGWTSGRPQRLLTQIQVAHEDVRRHPASRHFRATTFSRAHPRLLNTLACAHSAVLAKHIEWQATLVGTHCQMKKRETMAQKNGTTAVEWS